MQKKEVKSKEIIDAIASKFESVQGYADHLNVSRQSVYDRIYRKSRKFLRQLEKDGIVIEEPNVDYANANKQESELEELKEKITEIMKLVLTQQNQISELEEKFKSLYN